MAENSKIEWCDHTFNPIRGCEKISPGCANCYAARDAVRFPLIRGIWGNSGTRVVAVPDAWKNPVKWNRMAASCGHAAGADGCPICSGPLGPHRPRVFCASLGDVFEDWRGELRFPAQLAPEGWLPAFWDGKQMVREFADSAEAQGLRKATMDDMRVELFQLIEATPNLDWLLLTKRPGNVMRMVPDHWRKAFPENVWMGTTVEDQQRAGERIPLLLGIPAKVRFLSCEPLLGPVDLEKVIHTVSPGYFGDCFGPSHRPGTAEQIAQLPEYPKIHWVICGGESGPNARPMHPDWARSLRDQCVAAGVPFLFKQWGEWSPRFDQADRKAFALAHDGTLYRMADIAPGGARRADALRAGHDKGRLCCVYHVGKEKSGRLLDGREWNEFPSNAATHAPGADEPPMR